MKFKKNLKRFWTLSRQQDGFTLVELIVVIAILAILAGVAVPAYSGYVTKANKQADMTLISEIEHALTLAYYNQDLTEGEAGCLWLSPVLECYSEGENIDKAMEKAFGVNWPDAMQLQYDSWGVKNQMISYDDAKAVVESNFVQKYSPNELMAQVQSMTNAVNGLQLDIPGGTAQKLVEMFNYGEGDTAGNAIDDVIKEYYGDTKTWDDFNATEKSNLLVLATASSISNGQDASAAALIPQYALYAAYAAENTEFNKAYETFQNTINNIDPESADSEYVQIKNAYNILTSEADKAGFKAWQAENGDTHEAAFEAVMAGVGNAMKDNGDKIIGDLGNVNMFTSGVGNELYNDYLNEVYATATSDGVIIEEFMYDAAPGEVLIQYAVVNGKLYIVNSLPVG